MNTFILALDGSGFAWLMTPLGAAVVFFFTICGGSHDSGMGMVTSDSVY